MKKKYLNIVLVIILVFIWGSIIHKYFGSESEPERVIALNSSVTNYSYSKDASVDTFQLELTNTNPFMANSRKKYKKPIVEKSRIQRNTNKIVNKKIAWPKMSYHGFVKSNDKETRLVILKVNNRLYRKREKEKINELIVVKAYEDSLILSNNNELKTITKIDERS